MEWFAFISPQIDQQLFTLLQLIESSPCVLPAELEKKIHLYVSESGTNRTDSTGNTLLHAAWSGIIFIFLFLFLFLFLMFFGDLFLFVFNLKSHVGNLNLVKWLVSHNANIESTDKTGCTPLLAALCNGHTKVIVYLFL